MDVVERLLIDNGVDQIRVRQFLKLYQHNEKQSPHLFWNTVKIALDMSQNQEFVNLVTLQSEKASLEHQKIEFSKLLCYYMYIPGLADIEKTELSTKSVSEIMDYIIERTSRLGGNDNIVQLLKSFKQKGIDLSYPEDIEQFFKDFTAFMKSTEFICFLQNLKDRDKVNKSCKLPSTVATSITKVKNGKYISIDMQSACFSILFYYIGPLYGFKSPYESRQQLAKLVSNKEWIYCCKNMISIAINKMLKEINFLTEVENCMQYVINRLACHLYGQGEKIVMVNNDEVVIEDRDSNFKLDVEELRKELGDIVDKFKTESFELISVTDQGEKYVVKKTEHNERKYLADANMAYRLFMKSC